MSPNVRLVRDFIAAWNQNDIDRVMGFFAPDCVYDNVPVGPVSMRRVARWRRTSSSILSTRETSSRVSGSALNVRRW